MKLIQSVTLAAVCLAASTTAFLVERDLPEGIYLVKQVPSKDNASNTTNTLPNTRRRQHKRADILGKDTDIALWQKGYWPNFDEYSVPLPISDVQCYRENGILNQWDYRRAIAQLKRYCQGFDVSPRGAYISVSGQAVVYACSFAGRQVCHKYEWNEAEKALDDSCGVGMDGFIWMADWEKKYGRTHVGASVCEKVNEGQGKEYRVAMVPVWVEGEMYEQWMARNARGEDERKDGLGARVGLNGTEGLNTGEEKKEGGDGKVPP